jgi:predicted TIM-barrel fold metal-dependent hydrolase
MQNAKTISPPRKPRVYGGWVRKAELDAYIGRQLPIPTQVVSNGEFYPLPQTREQYRLERHLTESSVRIAKSLRIDRQHYLRSPCGMAAAFASLNQTFGSFFSVGSEETRDPLAKEHHDDYFIFDVQTHFVVPGHAETKIKGRASSLDLRRASVQMIPDFAGSVSPEDLYLQNYIKEVFLDSDTDVACISGIPAATEDMNILPYAEMVRTRDWINRITSSQRMVSHGLLMPDAGVAENRERMQIQAENLRVDAWKGYTGLGLGSDPRGWWLDDEKISYPALEHSRKLGVRNVCLHKGLALGVFDEEHCHPRDIAKAARDFPDLNFLIYHSGFKSLEDSLPAAQDEFRSSTYVPWVSDLCAWRKANPDVDNVYMELGGTFGIMVVTSPLLCCHVLGMIIDAFGADHVLWGTDSIWLGSPQWQIEALQRLQMPDSLCERFGYAPLTSEVKRQIFGLNGARLYRVDPRAVRNAIPDDYVGQLQREYADTPHAGPSNTQYGWVRTPDSLS